MIWRFNHTEEITTDGGSEMKESGVVAEIREISKKKKKKEPQAAHINISQT